MKQLILEGALNPYLVDLNNDNLLDLIVSNFGEFDLSVPVHYSSSISSFINIGTPLSPSLKKLAITFKI